MGHVEATAVQLRNPFTTGSCDLIGRSGSLWFVRHGDERAGCDLWARVNDCAYGDVGTGAHRSGRCKGDQHPPTVGDYDIRTDCGTRDRTSIWWYCPDVGLRRYQGLGS
jgi:hypothetical protein